MKKTRLFLALACLTLLSSCGGAETSSSEEPTSSQTSSSSTTNIKVTVSGESTVMVGKTIQLSVRVSRDSADGGFTASVSDDSVLSIEVDGDYINVTGLKIGTASVIATSVTDPTVSGSLEISVVAVQNPTLSLSADKTMIMQNETINLTASVTDYDGDVEYSWKSLYSKGSFAADGASAVYTGSRIGSDTLQVSFTVGSEVYSETVEIYVEADHTGWTAISTVEDVNTYLLVGNSTTITGNYYLTNDIDLNGQQIYANSTDFAGYLDGQGYSISNFEIMGNTESDHTNGGFFSSISGNLYAIGFEDAVIGETGSAWGTAVLCCACTGNLENVFVDVSHTYNNALLADANDWFPFNAALVGIFKEGTTYRNIVVNVDETADGYGTIFADNAYPAGGSAGTTAQNEQTFTVQNFYTNSDVIGGSVWEWGSPVEDQSGYTVDINWSTASSSTYDLNSDIWSIADNTMPTLIGLGE